MPEKERLNITIRRADADDRPALADLRWTWRALELGEGGESKEDYVVAFGDWLAEHEEGHCAFVAELDRRVVGMAFLAIIKRIPSPRRFFRRAGLMQSVYVLAEARDQGIGRALVDAVIAEARERDLEYLIVHPSERAFPLYRRAGFAVTDSLLQLQLR